MVDHVVRVAVAIFNAVFPSRQAVLYEASNNSSYVANAFRVENITSTVGVNKAYYERASCTAKGYYSKCRFRWNIAITS